MVTSADNTRVLTLSLWAPPRVSRNCSDGMQDCSDGICPHEGELVCGIYVSLWTPPRVSRNCSDGMKDCSDGICPHEGEFVIGIYVIACPALFGPD